MMSDIEIRMDCKEAIKVLRKYRNEIGSPKLTEIISSILILHEHNAISKQVISELTSELNKTGEVNNE
jgi:hypothetical protein